MATNDCAAALEDGEFWLPPQFLTDDDPSPEDTPFHLKFGSGIFPPGEFATGGRTPSLSSPGESLVGSSEDNSDEEDFFADLTRKVAQSTLGDSFSPQRKGLYPSGSPKSTLCSGCGCGHGSIWGNTGGAAQLKSPPPPTLDLLYQAAGKVATMRLNQQRQQIQLAQYLLLQQHRLIHLSDSKADEALSYPYQPPLPQQRSAFQPPKASSNGVAKYGSSDSLLSSSAWPTLQRATQPRREPVPANTNARPAVNVLPRGSAGTGVFLPRRAGNLVPEPKRKQGCSTVLIPAKVAQALNRNLDGGGSLGLRSRTGSSRSCPQAWVGQEIKLPNEWTY